MRIAVDGKDRDTVMHANYSTDDGRITLIAFNDEMTAPTGLGGIFNQTDRPDQV